MNPFVTGGYAGSKYFCDREKETEHLKKMLTNGNNVALISPRRLGKTDLLRHCFAQPDISDNYYTFVIDIYSTKNLGDFVDTLGKAILEELKPKGRAAWERFIQTLSSLRSEITFDINGLPQWSIRLGQISSPRVTLDEIFKFLNTADKHCFVAIDEFQQITKYEKDGYVEAAMRTYVQQCTNANFVFAGSQRHLMSEMFLSAARPFFQQVSLMGLEPIDPEKYTTFCQEKFKESGKEILPRTVEKVYTLCSGVTAYLQKVMNILFTMTPEDEACDVDKVATAVNDILNFSSTTFESLIYQMPEKQYQLFLAIAANGGKAKSISGGAFINKYRLPSSSSVLSASKGLLEKELISYYMGEYVIYDLFLLLWIQREKLGMKIA